MYAIRSYYVFLSFEDLLPVIALALLAGLNGPKAGRLALFVVPELRENARDRIGCRCSAGSHIAEVDDIVLASEPVGIAAVA